MPKVWLHAPHPHPHLFWGFDACPFRGIIRHQYRYLRSERGFTPTEARIVVMELLLAGSGGRFETRRSVRRYLETHV